MVRFIILKIIEIEKERLAIYIPLWLDLLSSQVVEELKYNYDLHSTMVRFIIPSVIFETLAIR